MELMESMELVAPVGKLYDSTCAVYATWRIEKATEIHKMVENDPLQRGFDFETKTRKILTKSCARKTENRKTH